MPGFRNYTSEPFFTDDYRSVREFLIRVNRDTLTTPNFTWGRWEWMTTHRELNVDALGKIGLWEENGEIVGLATFEGDVGEAFLVTDPRHTGLRGEMLDYALKHLARDGSLLVSVADGDCDMARLARSRGFRPTQGKSSLAVMELCGGLDYRLPPGFGITSLADGWDDYKYDKCMSRAFNPDGEFVQTDELVYEHRKRKQMLSSPMILPELVVAVTAPDGEYAAHCGLWYRPGEDYLYVEPVATLPEYQKTGLGRAAVYESLNRAAALGAKRALVSSHKQFYYNLGFNPLHNETWWESRR